MLHWFPTLEEKGYRRECGGVGGLLSERGELQITHVFTLVTVAERLFTLILLCPQTCGWRLKYEQLCR
jgi:hypothetical protein